MLLSRYDIHRLYGPRLYVLQETAHAQAAIVEKEDKPTVLPTPSLPAEKVEESAAPAVASPPPAVVGHAIQWKLKPSSTLALLMTQADFSNRILTQALKQLVLDAGIPVESIGFGILPEESPWDFAAMPVPVAALFSDLQDEGLFLNLSPDKRVMRLPALAQVALNVSAQQKVVQALQKI